MRLHVLRFAFALGLLSSVIAPPALAQDRGVQVGLGASFLQFDAGTGPGFGVDVAGDIAGPDAASLGLVGDFAWHREDDVDAMSFAGGARFTARPGTGRVMPYGQFILGRIRFSEDGGDATANMFAPGAGVQVRLGGAVGVFGQVDVVIVRFSGGDGETGQRYRFGVVVGG